MGPKPCQDHCCASLVTFKDELITKTPDLTNAIHPIFRRSNFRTFKHNSSDGSGCSDNDSECSDDSNLSPDDVEFTDEYYELLRPSLQLASFMIQSDAVLPYIIRSFDGEVTTGLGTSIPSSQHHYEMSDDEIFSLWDVHLSSQPDQVELNPQNRQRVAQILNAIVEMMEIEIGNPHREVA